MARQVTLALTPASGSGLTYCERKAYSGFSWTCLFFSWLVPLFRGDYIAGVALAILWFIGFSLLLNILMAFFYNGFFLSQLKKTGWVRVDDNKF